MAGNGKKRSGRSVKEFRKLNNKKGTGHPTYIYAKVGKEYKYIGITHADITGGVKNIRLEDNPNPKDKRTSYLRPSPGKENRSAFGKRLDGWRFSERDKPKVEQIIGKNKKPRKPEQ